MRAWAVLLGLLAGVACSETNPAYEGSGGASATGPSESTSASTSTTSGPTSVDTGSSGNTGSGNTDSESSDSESSDGDSSGGDPASYERCRAQLYGVSQNEGLYLIDVEGRGLMPVVGTPPSIAVATHPVTGEIWLSPTTNSGQLLVLDPGDFSMLSMEWLPVGMTTPFDPWPTFSRADFDHQGNLWMGGLDTPYFIQYQPEGPQIAEWQIGSLIEGGDMIMMSESEALLFTNTPPAFRVTFGAGRSMMTTVDVQGIPLDAIVTGIAFVGDELWASAGLDLEQSLMLHLEQVGDSAFQATDDFLVDVRLDDLSPVIVSPTDCP